jgi:nitroimidazol reductase NimA-like FMN-containing flavoprotein (pyridoxamine 5'-phosphate oxidase superfamily)
MRKALRPSERRFVERVRVCRVGSVARDGRPHVAPLCHALDGRIIYVATDRESRTARNLRGRPRAAIVCDEYFEDWDRIRGVAFHARARKIDRGPELERARRALARKFRQYRGYDLDYVIAFQIEGATSWGL